MRMRDFIRLSLRGFSGAWLSVASILLGVAVAISVPLSFAAFSRDLLAYSAYTTSLSAHTSLRITLRAAPPASLTTGLLREFLNLPGVRSASGEATLPGIVSYGEHAVATPVSIIETVFASGMITDPRDTPTVLHSSLALALGDSPESFVGEDISVIVFPTDENASGPALPPTRSAHTVRVSSVTDDPAISGSLRLSRDAMPLVPVLAFDRAMLEVSAPSDLPLVRGLLSERGFLVADSPLAADDRGERFSTLALFSLTVLTVLTALLLIPWLAVRLAALLALRARDTEFLRSAGVSPRGVFALILGESALIGFLGGAFGIILGVALHRALLAALHVFFGGVPVSFADPEFALRPGVLLVVLALSSATLAVSGVFSARRAARGLLSRRAHSL